MTSLDFERFAVDAVLSESNQVVVVVDTAMIVRWASPSTRQYLSADVVGRSIVDFVHPEDLGRAAQAFDVASELDMVEPSLMAHAIVSVRLWAANRYVPFDASGRWVKDESGDWWLVAILYDVTTRHAADAAVRTLAAGSDVLTALEAILAAARDYGGVEGAQVVWHDPIGGEPLTAGDLGSVAESAVAVIGSIDRVVHPAKPLFVPGAAWGYAFPLVAGSDRLGALAVWGRGPSPDAEFASAAVAPLLDLASLAVVRGREQAELRRRATTDAITGLLNRHGLFELLGTVPGRTAVMYVDLDGFKRVNDEHGHTLGDRVLGLIGRCLADAVQGVADVGRIGGDEFAVVAFEVDEAGAEALAEHVVDSLRETFLIDGISVSTGASVGVAHTMVPADGRALLDRADQALLTAKAAGKGRAAVDLVS